MSKNASKLTKDVFIYRTDASCIGQLDYLTDTKLARLREFLNERKYSVGDLGISYRIINHWEKVGILPDGVKSGGWRKFNRVELVWLHAVVHMRKFGLPLDKIVRLKQEVTEWDSKKDRYELFEYYIAKAFGTTDNSYIVVFENGNGGVGSSGEIEMSKRLNNSGDMLLISLKDILKERGHKVPKADGLFQITKGELEFLEKVRMGENKEIRAKIKDNKISEIETTENYPEAPPLDKINKEFKDAGVYGEMTVKFENGVRQSAQVKKKKLLK